MPSRACVVWLRSLAHRGRNQLQPCGDVRGMGTGCTRKAGIACGEGPVGGRPLNPQLPPFWKQRYPSTHRGAWGYCATPPSQLRPFLEKYEENVCFGDGGGGGVLRTTALWKQRFQGREMCPRAFHLSVFNAREAARFQRCGDKPPASRPLGWSLM